MKEDDKFFIDSNIWLYSFIESKDKQKNAQARKIIKRPDENTVKTFNI